MEHPTDSSDTAQPSTARAQESRPIVLFAGMIGLLVFSAITTIGGVFLVGQQHQISALRSSQATLNNQIQQMENSALGSKNSIQSSIGSMDQKITALESKLDISALSATALAEHAIQSAHLHLQATGDTDLALRLLRLARAPLEEYHTPAIEKLKTNLDQDIAQLTELPPLHITERLSALNTLIDQINALPIIISPVKPQPSLSNKASDWTNWRQNWRDSLEKLKSLVVIHKTTAEKDFFLTPEQVLLAKQLCMAELMQTEWALLHRDPVQFVQTLQNAKKMLESLPVPPNRLTPVSSTIDALLQDPLPNPENIELTG